MKGDSDFQTKREKIYGKLNYFKEILNRLMKSTGKALDTDENENMVFRLNEITLTPYQLSAGEKQLLIILLTVLIDSRKPSILIMDEPEISLHLEWQEQLIDIITKLNPSIQLIIATHSPGIIMKGWLDKVTEIESLVTKITE